MSVRVSIVVLRSRTIDTATIDTATIDTATIDTAMRATAARRLRDAIGDHRPAV